MTLRLFSWNVDNPHKSDVVKNLLKERKCDVVCIQETKLDIAISTIVKSLWGNPFVDRVVLDAIHTKGDSFDVG